MSPRMYSLVWTALGVVAAIMWLGGVFSLFVGVVFGFIAFGLVFMGMMCVLPSTVSQPAPAKAKRVVEKAGVRPAAIPTFRSV